MNSPFCRGAPPCWAAVDTGDAFVRIPVVGDRVEFINVDGRRESLQVKQARMEIRLPGDAKMPPPLLVIDPS